MLIKPTAQEAEKYIDFAYELALDPSRSGYPTYTDGIKTKEDFVEMCRRGVTKDNREVLLYLENGIVCGWIGFFYEEENRYLQTDVFNIAGDIHRALEEFIEYCAANFTGYDLYLGFPGDNKDVIDCLTRMGWPCEERSYNDVLFLDRYETQPELPSVVRVTKDNFDDFRKLHTQIEGEMYWNSDRLYAALDQWDIWMYYDEGKPAAAIYYMDARVLVEIFGLDFDNNRYDENIFCGLLAKALNECKRQGKQYVVFFNDDESQPGALRMGFRCVGEYVLFTKKV